MTNKSREALERRVREAPLLERLEDCRRRIGRMCSKGRPPHMTIPTQWDDDDFFIVTTLKDAMDMLSPNAKDTEKQKLLSEIDWHQAGVETGQGSVKRAEAAVRLERSQLRKSRWALEKAKRALAELDARIGGY